MCFLCNRLCHKECYNQEEELKKGLHFICSICDSKAKEVPDEPNSQNELMFSQWSQEITSAQIEKHQKKPSTPESQRHRRNSVSSTESQESDSTENSHRRSDKENKSRSNQKSEKKICPLYCDNICPHGISGRGCSFRHPPRCYKYSKFGEDPWKGCTRGSRCWFFHPRLCENSVKLKMCLTKTCKEIHLIGTRRFKPRENSSQHQDDERYSQREQNFKPPMNSNEGRYVNIPYGNGRPPPWNNSVVQPQNPTEQRNESVRSNNQNATEDESTFLRKFLESMKADLASLKSLDKKIENLETSVQAVKDQQTRQAMMQSAVNPQIISGPLIAAANTQPATTTMYHQNPQIPGPRAVSPTAQEQYQNYTTQYMHLQPQPPINQTVGGL